MLTTFPSDFELITGIGEISFAEVVVDGFVVGVKLVRVGVSLAPVIVLGDLARDGVFAIDGAGSPASNCSRSDATVAVVVVVVVAVAGVVVELLVGFGDVGVGETSRITVDGDCERG